MPCNGCKVQSMYETYGNAHWKGPSSRTIMEHAGRWRVCIDSVSEEQTERAFESATAQGGMQLYCRRRKAPQKARRKLPRDACSPCTAPTDKLKYGTWIGGWCRRLQLRARRGFHSVRCVRCVSVAPTGRNLITQTWGAARPARLPTCLNSCGWDAARQLAAAASGCSEPSSVPMAARPAGEAAAAVEVAAAAGEASALPGVAAAVAAVVASMRGFRASRLRSRLACASAPGGEQSMPV